MRRHGTSLGLPIAYLYLLLMIHVPGALAHIFGRVFLRNTDLTAMAMNFAAAASVCFVAGVWWSRSSSRRAQARRVEDRRGFCLFCLLGGWCLTYGLSFLHRIPSLGAAVDKGAGIWMLGVMLGLRVAVKRQNLRWVSIWLGSLMFYPIVMLLLGGFLSYGAWSIVIVGSILTISTRSGWRVGVGLAAFAFLSLSVFVSYYQHRRDIRAQVWGGAPLEARIDSALDTVRDFNWIDPDNPRHMIALDERLNQNYFVGLSARRIQDGQVGYLKGASLWEGMLALVPRIFWPEKPVFAGSPQIVSKMTGLRLSPTTSFGVGNVMEFQINFGMPGVIIGFFGLGWLIGMLDLRAALAEVRGDGGTAILYFLPGIALIDPEGSLVELFSGAAAALVGALVWKHVWNHFEKKRSINPRLALQRSVNHVEGPRYRNEPAT